MAQTGSRQQRITKFLVGHTYELVDEILARPEVPADLTISRFFGKRRYLGSHDRGFIADTTYALLRDVIRLRRLLDALIEHAGEEFESAILLAAHLLETEEHIDRTMLAEGLELDPVAIGEVATELREAQAEAATLSPFEQLVLRAGLPEWLVERVAAQVGEEEAGSLLDALNRQAPITLRANRLHVERERLIAALEEHDIHAVPGRYSPDAAHLVKRMNAYSIPEFRRGWFELQDEGSQLLSTLLDPRPNWRVFDACAGAGGKTLHLAAIMRGRGEVVAHDVNGRRLGEIRPRLKRSGAQNVRVMEHDLYLAKRDELRECFNALMIDAPCSGSGVLRRNPGARLTLDEETVRRLSQLQGEILREYSGLVRPGGLMLYATCSLLREENEAQVERFLAEVPGWSIERVNAPEEMITSEGFFRCYPHRHNTDAFFGALLRRS